METGFQALFSFNPDMRPQIESLLAEADSQESEMFYVAMTDSQQILQDLFYGNDKGTSATSKSAYRSATLYNEFGDATEQERVQYRQIIDKLFGQAKAGLQKMIAKSDEDLLANSSRDIVLFTYKQK